MTEVLVVDGDPQIRDLIGALLLNHRVKLEYASTVQTGADLLRTKQFDVAILDEMLSELPGPDLAELAASENIPILFMTTNSVGNGLFDRPSHSYIEKKFIGDHLPQQFARILLEAPHKTDGVAASTGQINSDALADTDVLVDVRAEAACLTDSVTAERYGPDADRAPPMEPDAHDLVAHDVADMTMEPTAPLTFQPIQTGHLGTLVRHCRSATFEICFSLEDDIVVVAATRARQPVPLDFNKTVKELVSAGLRIFAHSAWRLKHGRLVRVR